MLAVADAHACVWWQSDHAEPVVFVGTFPVTPGSLNGHVSGLVLDLYESHWSLTSPRLHNPISLIIP